jgi:hypothetical protein
MESKKNRNIVLTVLLAVTLLNPGSIRARTQASDPNKQEFLRDYSRFKDLWQAKDVKKVKTATAEVQQKWAQRNREYYGKLMLRVCVSLRSSRLTGPESYALAREYALLALKEPNQISLETELGLVGQVTSYMATCYAPEGQEWAQEREEDVQVRFHVWRRLDTAIDKDWDPNEFWSLKHPRPPLNVPWVMGNPPEAIEDPKIRAEYEAALKEYGDKVEYHNRQRRLREMKKQFERCAEGYIISAYSKPPFDLAELTQYIGAYVSDRKTRARILDAVRKNMNRETSPRRSN